MKICAAQIRPFKGDIDRNAEKHKKLIDIAVTYGVELIFFPELSLTGYEPRLAKELAIDQEDKRLDDFQEISDTKNISIGMGIPTVGDLGLQISMIIFQPNKPRRTYSKQHLHPDELPYFVKGHQQLIGAINNMLFTPAICYESLVPEHSESIFESGAEIYLASVAKSANGSAKAYEYYPKIAKQYATYVLMSNCIGPSDDFESIGQSAIWSKHGVLLGQLDDANEGILIVETDTEEITNWTDKKNSKSSVW